MRMPCDRDDLALAVRFRTVRPACGLAAVLGGATVVVVFPVPFRPVSGTP